MMVIFLAFPLLGMGRAPAKSKIPEPPQGLALQAMVEDALGELEYAYAAGDFRAFMGLVDKDFEGYEQFGAALKSYLLYVKHPHIHFIIEMIIADKSGIKARLHWVRRALTPAQVAVKVQGKAQLFFRRYPEALKLKGIDKENPFY